MLKKVALALVIAVVSLPALAESKLEKNHKMGVIVGDEITKKECGACHLPFAPINLPKVSWVKIMNELPNHFGEDASLEEGTRKHIEDYMISKAMDSGLTMFGKISAQRLAKRKRAGKPIIYTRLSSLPGWARHHDERHVKPEEWKKVKSKADCRACHPPGVGG